MCATCDLLSVRSMFGIRLRRARKQCGLSQHALAVEVGYKNRGTIGQLEAGAMLPSMEKAVLLAHVLGLSLGDWMAPPSRRLLCGHASRHAAALLDEGPPLC